MGLAITGEHSHFKLHHWNLYHLHATLSVLYFFIAVRINFKEKFEKKGALQFPMLVRDDQ